MRSVFNFLCAERKGFAVLLCLGISVLLALSFWFSKIPSDSQMATLFEKNKPILEVLLDKISHEPPEIVGIAKDDHVMVNEPFNWVSPDKAGFSSEHFSEYKTLMRNAGVISLWRRSEATEFAIARRGFAGAGWGLTFVHEMAKPAPLVSSIDGPPREQMGNGNNVYRPLGGDWYIRLYLGN